jgi:hypothetical protein
MNIYKQLFIILLSVFPFTANAFISISDNIIIDGKVHELYDDPLEKNTELAKKLREILPEKVTLDGKVWERTYTTSCSREYVATWEIADNKLFLRKIEFQIGLYGKSDSSDKYQWIELPKEKLENVFAQYLTDDGIQAKWVNSLIFTKTHINSDYKAGYHITTYEEVSININEGCVQEPLFITDIKSLVSINHKYITEFTNRLSKEFPWDDFPHLKEERHIWIDASRLQITDDGTLVDCTIKISTDYTDQNCKEILAIKRVLKGFSWPVPPKVKAEQKSILLIMEYE